MTASFIKSQCGCSGLLSWCFLWTTQVMLVPQVDNVWTFFLWLIVFGKWISSDWLNPKLKSNFVRLKLIGFFSSVVDWNTNETKSCALLDIRETPGSQTCVYLFAQNGIKDARTIQLTMCNQMFCESWTSINCVVSAVLSEVPFV